MNTVNFNSNYEHRVTLRLTNEQWKYLESLSQKQGVTISKLIRRIIDSVMLKVV